MKYPCSVPRPRCLHEWHYEPTCPSIAALPSCFQVNTPITLVSESGDSREVLLSDQSWGDEYQDFLEDTIDTHDYRDCTYFVGIRESLDPARASEDEQDYEFNLYEEDERWRMLEELGHVEEILLHPGSNPKGVSEMAKKFYYDNAWRLGGERRLTLDEIEQRIVAPPKIDMTQVESVADRLDRQSKWTFDLRGEDKAMTERTLSQLASRHNYLVNVSSVKDADQMDGVTASLGSDGALQWWLTDDKWEAVLQSGHPALNYLAALPASWASDESGKINPPKSLVTVLDLKKLTADSAEALDRKLLMGEISSQRDNEAVTGFGKGNYGGSHLGDAQISMLSTPVEAKDYLSTYSAADLYEAKEMPDGLVAKSRELFERHTAAQAQIQADGQNAVDSLTIEDFQRMNDEQEEFLRSSGYYENSPYWEDVFEEADRQNQIAREQQDWVEDVLIPQINKEDAEYKETDRQYRLRQRKEAADSKKPRRQHSLRQRDETRR